METNTNQNTGAVVNSDTAVTNTELSPVKRGRGRPRKHALVAVIPAADGVKRGRGRPRKALVAEVPAVSNF